MNATIKDVARIAGVSIATVSRVLNKSEKVREDTRNKILKAIVDTGYVSTVNQKEKNLKSIYVLLPENDLEFCCEFCRGIEEAAYSKGYETVITHSGMRNPEEFRILRENTALKSTGIITFSPNMEKLMHDTLKSKIPSVSVFPRRYLKSDEDCQDTDSPKNDSVGIYSVETVRKVLDELVSSGKKELAILFSENTYISESDIRTAAAALRENDKEIGIRIFDLTDSSPFKAEEKTAEILKRKETEFSAVFCTSDWIAAGVCKGILKSGLKSSNRISVVGMGDSHFSSFLSPSLSTVGIPKTEMGKSAVQLLVDRMENPQRDSGTYKNVIFPSRLIIRDSFR